MYELDEIDKAVRKLDNVLSQLKRNKVDFADSAASAGLNTFRGSLLLVKSNLMQVGRRMVGLKVSLREDAEDRLLSVGNQVDEFHKNAPHMSAGVVSDELDLMKRQLATLKGVLPLTELELQLNRSQVLSTIPTAIRGEVKADLEDVERCYSVQSYRGVMTFCGRILEVALGRKYCEVKLQRSEVNGIEEAARRISDLTLGQIAQKCRDENIINDIPGLDEYVKLINSVRIPSVHHKQKLYVPGRDAAKGAISITIEALRTIFA